MRIIESLGRFFRLRLLALSAGIAYVAGFIGYMSSGLDVPDSLYASLQLFFLDYKETGFAPLPLNIARFLAAGVSLSALLAAGISLFRNNFDRIVARRMRNHYVVCGLGTRGTHLARSLRTAGHRVVAIERNPGNPAISETRRIGIPVIVGDATQSAVLRSAGLMCAIHVVVLTHSDASNAAIVSRISRLRPEIEQELDNAAYRGCHVHAHISAATWDTLMTSFMFRSWRPSAAIEWFNLNRIAARELLSFAAPIPKLAPSGDDGAEIADPAADRRIGIIGSNELSHCLVLEEAKRRHYLRMWSATSSPRQIVTFCDPEGTMASVQDLSSNEGLPQVIDIRLLSGKVSTNWDELAKCDAVFICLDDPAESIGYAWHLLERGGSKSRRIVVCSSVEIGELESLLARDPRATNLTFVNLHELACSYLIFENSFLEELARENHLAYLREVQGEPASKPWSEIDRQDRDSNRNAVWHHMYVKLPALRLEARPIIDFSASTYSFPREEVEFLAEMEHERWLAEKRMQGWKPAPPGVVKQDRHKRIHPDMVPWQELPEEKKEKDRLFIRALPRMLISAGYTLTKQDGSLETPGSTRQVTDRDFGSQRRTAV